MPLSIRLRAILKDISAFLFAISFACLVTGMYFKEKLQLRLFVLFLGFGVGSPAGNIVLWAGIIFFGKKFIYFWAGPGYDNAYYVAIFLIIPSWEYLQSYA